MKGKKILSLLLLTGMLASCRTSVDDSETNPEPVWPTSSESSSEHDHSHDSSESESESESHSGGGGGGSSSEEVDPCVEEGHDLYHYLAKEATCTEAGYKEAWYCNECGELFFAKPSKIKATTETNKNLTTNTSAILPALGHDYPDSYTVINDPDCEHNGLQIKECTRCGHQDEKIVPKLNHNYGPVTYDPDFVHNTVTASTHCANGHDLVETVALTLIKSVPGTCTTKGVDTYRSAKFNNDAFDQQTINQDTSIKHKLTYHAATPSTCNTHGSDAYYECKGGCGKFFANEGATIEVALNSWVKGLDADNHVHLDDVLAKNPTCTTVGYNAHKICPACGERIGYEEIPMTAHTANTKKWVSNGASGHVHACKDCDTLLTDTLEEHTLDHDPADTGYTGDIYCTKCNYLYRAGSGTTHTHQLTYVPGQEATCTTVGYKYYYSCQCGMMFSDEAGEHEISAPEAIAVKAHNYEHHEAQAPNCEVDGNYEYSRCKDCNQFFLQTDLTTPVDYNTAIKRAALGHDVSSSWSHDETYHWHQCSRCTHQEDKAAHIPDHSLTDELYEDAINCSECGALVRAARHVHKKHLTLVPAINATCNTAGSSAYYECTCGKFFADANAETEIEEDSWVINALGHDHEIHHERVAPTCMSTGMAEYYECSRCGAKQTYDGETYTVVTDPSSLVIAIDPTNHVHLDKHDAVSATCTAGGSTVYYSCVCGKYYSDAEGEHQIEADSWVTDPLTHQYEGTYYSDIDGHWQKCVHCGTDETVKHSHTSDRESPTATEPVKCSVCGYIIAPATGHVHADNLTAHAAVAATCTTDGNNEYYSCSCGKYFSDAGAGESDEIVKDSWVIKADHTYIFHSGTAATCIETGIKDHYDCSVCGKVFLKDANNNYTEITEEDLVTPINPTNHAHALTHNEAHEETCGVAGNIENYYCEDCGKYYSNSIGTIEIPASSISIPATNAHTYGEWEEVSAATCTTVGQDKRTCGVCGHIEYREAPALGHSATHVTAKSASCTEAGNKEYWYCSRCDKYFSNEAMTNEITQASTVIPALEGGHEYVVDTSVGINGFTFDAEGKTAEVNLKCTKTPGETHTHKIEAVVTSQVKTPATCTEKGVTTYTATYGDYSASVDKTDINALGHDWEFVSIVFATNGKSATVNYRCKNDSSHTTSILAEITDVVLVPATCETGGTTRYTATVTTVTSLDHQEHILTKDVNDIGPLGHTWTFVDIVFSEDGKSATANYVCSNDSDHKTSVTATVVGELTTPATCEAAGTTTYTATVQAEDTPDGVVRKATTTRDDVTALGHDYVNTYHWTSGSTDVTKVEICQNNPAHTNVLNTYTNSYSTYTADQLKSELAMDPSKAQWAGDYNIHFSNYKDGTQGIAYETTSKVRIYHNSSDTYSDNKFFVKIDNSYYYGSSWNSGSSYVVFYSDMTYSNDSQSNGMRVLNYYDSEGHQNVALSTDSTFYTQFLAFTRDCDVIITAKLDLDSRVTTLTLRYLSNVSGYESVDYTQTVRIQYSSNDLTGYNYVNSVRFARTRDTFGMSLLSFEASWNLDRNVLGTSCKNYNKSWGSYSVNRYVIIKADLGD